MADSKRYVGSMGRVLRGLPIFITVWVSLGVVACQDAEEQRQEIASLQTQVAILSQPSPSPTATLTPSPSPEPTHIPEPTATPVPPTATPRPAPPPSASTVPIEQAQPTATPVSPQDYCRQFEARRPGFASFSDVPPTPEEAAAIKLFSRPPESGTAYETFARMPDINSIPPRVAWYYLPFRGYEHPEADVHNQRAAENLLRFIGFIPGIGNPFVDQLQTAIPPLATTAHLALLTKGQLPESRGHQEKAIAALAVQALLAGKTTSENETVLAEALRAMANRYSRGDTALSDAQYCFMLRTGNNRDIVMNYMMDVHQLSPNLAAALPEVYADRYRRYLNELPLNPTLTFWEYVLPRR